MPRTAAQARRPKRASETRGIELSDAGLIPLVRLLTRPMMATVALWFVLFFLFLTFFPIELRTNTGASLVVLTASSSLLLWGFRVSTQNVTSRLEPLAADHHPTHAALICASSAYLLVAAFVYSRVLGLGDFDQLVDGISDPGSAYSSRKAMQAATDTQSTGTVLVSALGALYTFAVPLLVVSWSRLKPAIRLVGLAGPLAYLGYFLSTGTLKGLGDMLILLLLGFVTRSSIQQVSSGGAVTSWGRSLGRKLVPLAAILLTAWAMANAFSSRLGEREASLPIFQYGSSVQSALGGTAAAGLGTMVFYATNGFAGLGFSFVTSASPQILGGFKSLSYLLASYGGVADQYQTALPFQAEPITGYSATVNWWTIFPWLASSFGWVGTVVVFGLLGLLTGRVWSRVVLRGDTLALGLMGYLAILLAYVPANNQVFLSTPTTVGFISLLTAYSVRGFSRTLRRRQTTASRGRSTTVSGW